ncbi:MAG: MmgE/PrpD family protein [Dehalococcoidales bacterium]
MFTRGLSQFITRNNYEDLPGEVVTAAKFAILDFIGVVMAGSQDPSGRIISELVKENMSAPEATVIGWRYKASCSLAALANGSAGHALDYDDCLDFSDVGLAHPTTGIFPAALAVGEKLHISGRDLITAYCLGIEAYAKTGLLTKESYVGKRGWEWTGVLGVMGASASVSKVLKLDENQTVRAFGIAASLASGLIRNFGAMAGHLHAGNAARNGVEACLLAQKGYTGRYGIIEIPGGFYNAYTGTTEPVQQQAMEENLKALGNPWNIIKPGLMFKAFPCAHISHFGVDAGLQLRQKYSIDWRQIAEIEFRVPSFMGGAGVPPEPQKGVEGRFSLAYCLSRALINGKLWISDFTDDSVKDPDTLWLMRKIKFVAQKQDRLNGVFGYQEIVLKMNDGNTFSCKVEHPKGEPQNPQTPEELEAKYRDCAEIAHYDKKTSSRIKDLILNLEKVDDISQITTLIGV